MAGEVGEGPGDGGIALPDRVRAIDQRYIIELRAADALGLHDPEQAAFVQFTFGVLGKAAQLFRTPRAFAQARRQGRGARHHRRIGAVVSLRPGGGRRMGLQTGSYHLAILPIAACADVLLYARFFWYVSVTAAPNAA